MIWPLLSKQALNLCLRDEREQILILGKPSRGLPTSPVCGRQSCEVRAWDSLSRVMRLVSAQPSGVLARRVSLEADGS